MKKILWGLFLLSFFSAYAEELQFNEFPEDCGIFDVAWSPFQFAFIPKRYGQLVSSRAEIYGLAVGAGMLEQKSAVLSVALAGGQEKNYGIQCAAVTLSNLNCGLSVAPMISFIDRNYGVQVSFLNIEADGKERAKDLQSGLPGVQIGAFNVGQGFQIGILNLNPDGYIPILPLFNFPR